MTPIFAMINGPEVIAILAVCLVFFGAKRLPELARGLGKGIQEFKRAANEMTDEAMNLAHQSLPPEPPAVTGPIIDEPPHAIEAPADSHTAIAEHTSDSHMNHGAADHGHASVDHAPTIQGESGPSASPTADGSAP